MKYIFIFFSTMLWLIASCKHQLPNTIKDTFYSKKGGFDYSRLPLIKPYEAVKLNGTNEWIVNLKTNTIQFSASNVQEIAVTNGIILMHSTKTYLKGSAIKEARFIVIPSEKREVGFDNYYHFVQYLIRKGINKKPLLQNIETTFLKFNKGEKVF